MENQPNTNTIENIEQPLTKERVIALLLRFPDNTKPYVDYIKQCELETQSGSREEVEVKTFRFVLEQAEILRDAGFSNEAYHAYYDALEMANGKGMNEECEMIQAEIAKL
jgi:hypothetical protein